MSHLFRFSRNEEVRDRSKAISWPPSRRDEADQVIRVARAASQAEAIFGNREKALLWLRSPEDRLDGLVPFRLLRTALGGRWVEGILWQIEEGVYVVDPRRLLPRTTLPRVCLR
jgi:putative toxin-antitoxin system antitoxin component (TIGR02293 family)